MECFVSGDTYYESRANTPSSTTIYTDRRIAQRLSYGAQARGDVAEQTRLLRDLVAAQDRQNEFLEELVAQLSAPGKRRTPNLDNGNKPIRI